MFEFCSPKPTPSPAEIEEELRGLQDVPSCLRQYVEAEPAGKEGGRAVGGGRRWNKDDLGFSSMCIVFLVCAGHEGQEHSPPEMNAGEPKATLETGEEGSSAHTFSLLLL